VNTPQIRALPDGSRWRSRHPRRPGSLHEFDGVKGALEAAMTWEQDVTGRINRLMDLAIEEKDYATQDFLRWFVSEQVEEEANVSHLLTLVEALGIALDPHP
jgi:ferritin